MKKSLPVDLFSEIDMVVLERQADGSFKLTGAALDWFVRYYPESAVCTEGLEPGKRFVFLENFLVDAEAFWQENSSGLLKSGIWIEPDSSGSDCAFEATAVSLGEKKILLIKLCWMTYGEKQHIIQKGRELGLECHRIKRLEEALQKAQVDLKDRIERRTAKLFEANELLRQEIVERERVECALRESTETLKAILAASPVGIGLIRGKTIEWANKALHDLLECEDGSLAATHPGDYCSSREEYLGTAREMIAGIEKTGIGKVETNLLSRTGREFCGFLQGSPLDPGDLSRGIILAVVDITERKRAEEGRMLLATAIEHAAESIIITDSSGTIQYVNPAFEQTTGFARKEAVGNTPRILKSGSHDTAFYRALWDRLASGDVWSGHFINRRKDGSLYEVDETISPVFDASGNIVNYVAVKRDVTQEIKLKKQLHQAQKMQAIGTLAGGIAHDFNNILSVIIGYTELAMARTGPLAGLDRSLNGVLKASMRAKELVQQILTLTRQSEQQLEPLELAPVVKEALRFLRASLPATIEIRQEFTSTSARVLSNPTQIQQVVMNLVTNAAHSMREKGGVIEVDLCGADLGPDAVLLMPDLKPGRYARLSVRDTGHGMEPSVLENIFDPYFTTKAPGEGTGLGLAVVHGIVKSQGGHITVSSEAGKGSLFQVYFPGIAGSEKQEDDAVECPPGGRERLLLIDDETTLVEVVKESLEALGYSVVAETSSVQALELFRANPRRFDLVITDQTMPGMTGMVLARELLELCPDIPIILCTGYSEQVTRDRAREIGVGEFLMKPLIVRDLAKAIRRLLD